MVRGQRQREFHVTSVWVEPPPRAPDGGPPSGVPAPPSAGPSTPSPPSTPPAALPTPPEDPLTSPPSGLPPALPSETGVPVLAGPAPSDPGLRREAQIPPTPESAPSGLAPGPSLPAAATPSASGSTTADPQRVLVSLLARMWLMRVQGSTAGAVVLPAAPDTGPGPLYPSPSVPPMLHNVPGAPGARPGEKEGLDDALPRSGVAEFAVEIATAPTARPPPPGPPALALTGSGQGSPSLLIRAPVEGRGPTATPSVPRGHPFRRRCHLPRVGEETERTVVRWP